MSNFIYHVYAMEPATPTEPGMHYDGIITMHEEVCSPVAYSALKIGMAHEIPGIELPRLVICNLTLLKVTDDESY